jgi:hypothetical protein
MSETPSGERAPRAERGLGRGWPFGVRCAMRSRRYVQHWECDCGEMFSGPVEEADHWCADHLNGHVRAVTMRGRMTSLAVAPPLVRGLLAHPGGDPDVGPGSALAAGESDPAVEAGGLSSDGGDTQADLVEGVLLLPGGDGGNGGSTAEGFDGYVGDVHASTIDDDAGSRQPRMTP